MRIPGVCTDLQILQATSSQSDALRDCNPFGINANLTAYVHLSGGKENVRYYRDLYSAFQPL